MNIAFQLKQLYATLLSSFQSIQRSQKLIWYSSLVCI